MRNCILEGMKRLNGVAILAVVFLALLFSAAFRWRTETILDRGVPTLIRIDRFTGKTEVFNVRLGWRSSRLGTYDPVGDALVSDVLKQVEDEQHVRIPH